MAEPHSQIEIKSVEVVDPPAKRWPFVFASFVILLPGLLLLYWAGGWKITVGVLLCIWASNVRWV